MVDDIFERKWLSNKGAYVQQLEARICQLTGVNHAIAVCNATVGLEVVIRALGLTGEVIVPSFTFVATAHSLTWLGLTPVFCDINQDTHTLDSTHLEGLINARTSAIIPVHLWGQCCETGEIERIAEAHNLPVIYDAAHALGTKRFGTLVGGFGAAEVFSFHATKFINSFEGGVITTNSEDLAKTIRLMINFGFAGYDKVVSMGTNGKMNEVCAAMALTNLESFDEFVTINRSNRDQYRRELAGIPGISLFVESAGNTCSDQYVVGMVDSTKSGISRNHIMNIFWAENILARRYFYPGCHQMEPYRTQRADNPPELPVTDLVASQVLILPTGSSVQSEDICRICSLIRFVVENGQAISAMMSENTTN